MRGVEGALRVIERVEGGAFASEALRRLYGDIEPTERKLTGSLVYLTLRRLGLWRHLAALYCSRPPQYLRKDALRAILVGIAGLVELKNFSRAVLVNSIVGIVKSADRDKDKKEAPLVNAVLRAASEKAGGYIETLETSHALRDNALSAGVPGWVAAKWNEDYDMGAAKRLLRASREQTFMSLRASPNTDVDEWAAAYDGADVSDFMEYSVRLASNPYPPELPGYAEGRVTPQGEASMWAVESLLSRWSGGRLLDMCTGRGVKAGHILSRRDNAALEGWDISAPRIKAAAREIGRIGASDRAEFISGDALALEPKEIPSAILIDAPCSGSGTWGRHPEGKWRVSPEGVKKNAETQKKLLARAADILPKSGILMYCTCSLFRDENENVVGDIMASRNDLAELPPKQGSISGNSGDFMKKGRPYGTLIFPSPPWIDGFYAAMLVKK
ncbi:RNA methyltransferase [Synergistales bacterium]|nr:RNA methyltransferase [Synergistales bacterium]